tara:strand:+ start:440 stop:610 length:171 start_codon:yes stop_codon:yes gene_type:complete
MFTSNIYKYGSIESVKKAIEFTKNKIRNNPLNVSYKDIKHLEQLFIILNDKKGGTK